MRSRGDDEWRRTGYAYWGSVTSHGRPGGVIEEISLKWHSEKEEAEMFGGHFTVHPS